MKIGIVGCGGTMGRLLVHEVVAAEDCALSGGTGRPGSALIGLDVTEQAGLRPSGLIVADDAEALFQASDAVIDLSVADAAPRHARNKKTNWRARTASPWYTEPRASTPPSKRPSRRRRSAPPSCSRLP